MRLVDAQACRSRHCLSKRQVPNLEVDTVVSMIILGRNLDYEYHIMKTERQCSQL